MDATTSFRCTPRLVFGLLVAVAGALLVLDNLGVLDASDYFRFWPAALVVYGIARVLDPPVDARGVAQGRGFGLLLVFVGSWLLLANLHLAHVSTALLWPALILLFGLYLVWREVTGRRAIAPRRDVGDRIDAFAMLGGTKRVSHSRSFVGGSANAIMGGCEIDLRPCTPAPEGALLDAFALWGGIDVIVPDHWVVEVDGMPLLGGVINSTHQIPSPDAPRLHVRALAIMGGVEVKNQPADER